MGCLAVLAILISFSLLSNCYYLPDISYKIRDFCIDDSGIFPEMAEDLFLHRHKDLVDLESCYLNCVYIETGYITEDGVLVHGKFETLKNSTLTELDLDCLRAIGKLENCNDIMKLVKCHLI